jgi:hypothetical protein
MKPSQIAWLVSLAAFVSTALLNEKELLSPAMHHWVTFVSTIATAVSAFMLQRPAAMGGEPPAYFVVRDGGIMQKVDKRGFEQHALDVAQTDMPGPLVVEGD